MSDLFGFEAPRRAFKDIRNQRPSVAEQKAELAMQLRTLCLRIPQTIRDGSINKVREWQVARTAALKVAASSRSSVPELTSQISNMQRFA